MRTSRYELHTFRTQNPDKTARAAHLFTCYYADAALRHCIEEQIPEADIDRGAWIADQSRDIRALIGCIHGSPEYGRTPVQVDDIRKIWQDELAKRGISNAEAGR